MLFTVIAYMCAVVLYPARMHLLVRNYLVNEVEFLRLIPQN